MFSRKDRSETVENQVQHHYYNSAVFGKNEIRISGDSQDQNDDGLVHIVSLVVVGILLIIIGCLIYKVWIKNNVDKEESKEKSKFNPILLEYV